MIQALTHGRLLTALRLAFYPAFEPVQDKRFEALTREAENARGAGDLARAEELFLRAMAEAKAWSDPSHLNLSRHGLARVYQEEQRYREAEVIFRDQLEEAVNRPQSHTQLHAAHMSFAQLYQDERKYEKAEEHYKAALAETEKAELWPDRGLYCSTAMWLARFYVEQHRYSEAEPLFKRALEIREADRTPNSSLPHYLQEFAKVYEAQERYDAAEELYRRALKICAELGGPTDFLIVRALDNLAGFLQARGRYPEAEELSRKSLGIVEERIKSQTAEDTKAWLRWRNRKTVEARIKRARAPISAALDRLAEICECQEKYAEAEPLRRRSFEIKEQAWGETLAWIWVDSLAAYANALHKIGREPEAAKLDKRVEAIRANYPQGSVRPHIRFMSMPIKRTLRWRFATFMNALLHPSRR